MCRRVAVVVLCVCLSVTMLAATYLVYTSQVRFHKGCLWRFQDFSCVVFAENASFQKFGLPSWLLDDDEELSMDKRQTSV